MKQLMVKTVLRIGGDNKRSHQQSDQCPASCLIRLGFGLLGGRVRKFRHRITQWEIISRQLCSTTAALVRPLTAADC